MRKAKRDAKANLWFGGALRVPLLIKLIKEVVVVPVSDAAESAEQSCRLERVTASRSLSATQSLT